jgi:hypothetical protein
MFGMPGEEGLLTLFLKFDRSNEPGVRKVRFCCLFILKSLSAPGRPISFVRPFRPAGSPWHRKYG